MPGQNNNRRSGLAGGGLAGQGAAPRRAAGQQRSMRAPQQPQQARPAYPQQQQQQRIPQQRPPMSNSNAQTGVAQPMPSQMPYSSAPMTAQYPQGSRQVQQFAAQSAPMDKKARKRMEKEQKKQMKQQRKMAKGDAQSNKPKAGLIARIVFFFRTHSIGDIIQDICEWIDKNYFVPILAAAIFIVIGLFFNRYISFGAAFVILLIGIYLSRKDLERGQYACYAAAMIAFIVPYLF